MTVFENTGNVSLVVKGIGKGKNAENKKNFY
jgi:hypothetical protein